MQIMGEYGQRLAAGLRQSLQEKPGALIVCDTFDAVPGEPVHGLMAARAAREQGFSGPLAAVKFEDPADPAQQQRNRSLGDAVQGWGEAVEPAQIRQKLYESMLFTRLQAVETATDRLVAVAQAGVRHAALNLSVGSSPAMCVTAVLDMCENPESAERARAQLTRALGENVKAGLLEIAQRTSQDERLVEARQAFADSVVDFEKGHNSVVVAAGNDGTVARRLQCQAPEDFTRSDLASPETTVVGALEAGQPAAYNGQDFSVLAEGALFIPELKGFVHGTSFACPRVAADMAALHGRFPGLGSAEVERIWSEQH